MPLNEKRVKMASGLKRQSELQKQRIISNRQKALDVPLFRQILRTGWSS
jgi:hypothetical protein